MRQGKLWFFTPYSLDKDLGRAYNECMQLVPGQEDWAVLTDTDTLFFESDCGHIIRDHINLNPDAGMFGCYASRTGHPELRPFNYDGHDHDIISQHKRYWQVRSRYGTQNKVIQPSRKSGKHYVTGYFMVIKKSVWEQCPAPEHPRGQLLGIDVAWGKRITEAGYQLYCMQGMYVLHLWRAALGGAKYKEHLIA